MSAESWPLSRPRMKKPRKKPHKLKARYYDHVRRLRRGKISGCAAQKQKLTREQVVEIKKILLLEKLTRKPGGKHRAYGMRQRIAERYGISVHTVRRIIEGKRWKSVHTELRKKYRKRNYEQQHLATAN